MPRIPSPPQSKLFVGPPPPFPPPKLEKNKKVLKLWLYDKINISKPPSIAILTFPRLSARWPIVNENENETKTLGEPHNLTLKLERHKWQVKKGLNTY